MDTAVEFDSPLFRPFLPEDSQVNPQIYGAELAFWLAGRLAARGVITSYPEYEDWGWFLEYITAAGDEFWLCCGNREGEAEKWLCYLNPKARGFFGRRKPGPENARPLLEALRQVLEAEAGITNVRWHSARYGA